MKSKVTAYLGLIFLGFLGIHQFYLNKVFRGFTYPISLGIFIFMISVSSQQGDSHIFIKMLGSVSLIFFICSFIYDFFTLWDQVNFVNKLKPKNDDDLFEGEFDQLSKEIENLRIFETYSLWNTEIIDTFNLKVKKINESFDRYNSHKEFYIGIFKINIIINKYNISWDSKFYPENNGSLKMKDILKCELGFGISSRCFKFVLRNGIECKAHFGLGSTTQAHEILLQIRQYIKLADLYNSFSLIFEEIIIKNIGYFSTTKLALEFAKYENNDLSKIGKAFRAEKERKEKEALDQEAEKEHRRKLANGYSYQEVQVECFGCDGAGFCPDCGRTGRCKNCNNSGIDPRGGQCDRCRGKGYCLYCEGRGVCHECSGKGKVSKMDYVKI
jgi:TM2 domain-containing membrane protein YozV